MESSEAIGDQMKKSMSALPTHIESPPIRCDAIWEVCLENGRHKVTLRSALEIVNNCGSWLEVRCSTESFAAGKVEGDQTKKEVVGAVSS